MKKNVRISLSIAVAFYSVLVIAFGVAIDSAYRYLVVADGGLINIILRYTWHVMLIGVLIYLSLYIVLYRKIVRPVQEITIRLYGMTKGNFDPLGIDTNIREIQDMVECIKFLFSKMQKAPSTISAQELSKTAQDIRYIIKSVDTIEESKKYELSEIAQKIESAAETLAASSMRNL